MEKLLAEQKKMIADLESANKKHLETIDKLKNNSGNSLSEAPTAKPEKEKVPAKKERTVLDVILGRS